MYDDDFLDALKTARSINAGRNAEMPVGYSTADINKPVNPLAALGQMTFGKEADTGQAIRQHIGEAKDKPTLVGKALGTVGLDESGERARTPWGDAAISAAWMPYRFGESVWDALNAASDTLHGKHPLGTPIYSEEDAPPPSYVAQTDPAILQRGLNFAGTVASSSPIAPKPTNAAGMFGGRLAAENLARAGETRPLRALELAEKLQKEGATREEIYAKTNEILKDSPYAGVTIPADNKPRFEISDDKARFTGKGNLGGENGDLLLSNAFNHRELYRAYPDMKRIQLGYEIDPNAPPFVMGGQYIDPSKTEFKFESGTRQGEPVGEAIGYTAPNKNVMRTGLLHEGTHGVQYREGFAKGTNPEAAANASPEVKAIDRKIADAYLRFNEAKTPAERMYVQSELDGLDRLREKTVAEVGYPTYRRYKGEEEARLVQTRADLTPDERRARPPWLDSDIPESQQIVRLSSNPDDVKASIPGTVIRDAAYDEPLRNQAGQLVTKREWMPGGERVELLTEMTKPYPSGGYRNADRMYGTPTLTDEGNPSLKLVPRSDGSGEFVYPFTEREEAIQRSLPARAAPDLYSNSDKSSIPGIMVRDAAEDSNIAPFKRREMPTGYRELTEREKQIPLRNTLSDPNATREAVLDAFENMPRYDGFSVMHPWPEMVNRRLKATPDAPSTSEFGRGLLDFDTALKQAREETGRGPQFYIKGVGPRGVAIDKAGSKLRTTVDDDGHTVRIPAGTSPNDITRYLIDNDLYSNSDKASLPGTILRDAARDQAIESGLKHLENFRARTARDNTGEGFGYRLVEGKDIPGYEAAVAEAKAKGLDLSDRARLERAYDQGYDLIVPGVHGSRTEPFPQFDINAPRANDSGFYGKGHYFVNRDPDKAGPGYGHINEGYGEASYYGPNVAPYFLRREKPLDLGDYDYTKSELGKVGSWGSKLDKLGLATPELKETIEASKRFDDLMKTATVRKYKDGTMQAVVKHPDHDYEIAGVANRNRGEKEYTTEVEALDGLRNALYRQLQEDSYWDRGSQSYKPQKPWRISFDDTPSLEQYIMRRMPWDRTGPELLDGSGRLTKAAKDAGHDSIIYGDETAKFDNTGIRHFDAIFDPAKANSANLLASNREQSSLPGTLLRQSADDDVANALKIARSLDPLGYYSQALEAAKGLKQNKGTGEQFRAQLKNAGVKDAEIAATGLDKLLADKSITKEQIVKHLEDNRVGLKENLYGARLMPAQVDAIAKERMDNYMRWQSGELDNDTYKQLDRELEQKQFPREPQQKPKWQNYSLDPQNPTYRESVISLHDLGKQRWDEWGAFEKKLKAKYGDDPRNGEQFDAFRAKWTPEERAEYDRIASLADTAPINPGFKSGHWSEPNVIAHARTSIQKDTAGKPVFLIDELQSDWGQKVRDKGARDEGKIAAIKEQMSKLDLANKNNRIADLAEAAGYKSRGFRGALDHEEVQKFLQSDKPGSDEGRALLADIDHGRNEWRRLEAELKTAEAGAPSHPLVNTTDQWTQTAFRRLIKQAVDSGADSIALTPGKVQAERFGLERHFTSADVVPRDPREGSARRVVFRGARGDSVIFDVGDNGMVTSGQVGVGQPLSDVVGKELAERIMQQTEKRTLAGAELKVGGEGMKSTYDQMYPRTLGKLLAKMDPSVKMETRELVPHDFDPKGMTNIVGGVDKMSDTYRKWSEYRKGTPYENSFITFPITDKIREAVKAGQPLFSNPRSSNLPGTMIRDASTRASTDGNLISGRFAQKERGVTSKPLHFDDGDADGFQAAAKEAADRAYKLTVDKKLSPESSIDTDAMWQWKNSLQDAAVNEFGDGITMDEWVDAIRKRAGQPPSAPVVINEFAARKAQKDAIDRALKTANKYDPN